MMTVLYKDGDMELVIQDDRNYTYGRVVRGEKDGKVTEDIKQPAYFTSVDGAVRHICRLRANRRCHDLQSWLTEWKASIAYFEKLFN